MNVFGHYRTAELYDALNSWKDYPAEAAKLREVIAEFCRPTGKRLLDVACGTGKHLELLRADFEVEGLDLEPRMLEIAQRRCPDVPLHEGDMRTFNLGRQFDIVTCLFGAIAYCHTAADLKQAITTMVRHVASGGLLIVEPFIDPASWLDGHIHAVFANEPELKAARMNVSRREGRIAVLDFHYLVATSAGVEHFRGEHRLALISQAEMEAAFESAGMAVRFDSEGLMGRGLYIGSGGA